MPSQSLGGVSEGGECEGDGGERKDEAPNDEGGGDGGEREEGDADAGSESRSDPASSFVDLPRLRPRHHGRLAGAVRSE